MEYLFWLVLIIFPNVFTKKYFYFFIWCAFHAFFNIIGCKLWIETFPLKLSFKKTALTLMCS
jgi:hypothetical protein